MMPEYSIKAIDKNKKMGKVLYKDLSKEIHIYTAGTLLHESNYIWGRKKWIKNYYCLHCLFGY